MSRASDKNRIFMSVAFEIAKLGTCSRAHVGAVIVTDGRCISWGYNGAPPGAAHCEENFHGWAESFRYHVRAAGRNHWKEHEELTWCTEMANASGCRNATHAEANALAFAARQGISTEGASMYLTVSPCATCARLMIAAGLESVFYAQEYRDPEGIDVLKKALIVAAVLPSV